MSAIEAHESIRPLLHPEGSPEGPPEGGYFSAVNQIRGNVVVNSEVITWTLEVPAGDLAYDGVGHFIHGYGGIKVTSKPPSHAFAERGVATLRSRAARGGDLFGWWESVTDPQEIHCRAQQAIAADLRTDETRRKLGRIPNGTAIDVDKKVLLPHSMGILGATRYAEKEKGAVDAIVALMSVGFGSPTVALLAEHFPRGLAGSVWHELRPAVQHGDIELSLRNLKAVVHYYSNLRALFEARSCLREDVRPRISRLREAGVRVGYMAAKYDILVPVLESTANHVDPGKHVVLPNAGHLAPQCKSWLVADEAIRMLRT